MTAAELIAALSALPGDSEVMFDLGQEYINVGVCEEMGDSEAYAVLLSAPDYDEDTAGDRYIVGVGR